MHRRVAGIDVHRILHVVTARLSLRVRAWCPYGCAWIVRGVPRIHWFGRWMRNRLGKSTHGAIFPS